MLNKLVFNNITVENDKLWGGVSYTQIVNPDKNLTIGNVACASISFTSEIINLSYINSTCQYYVKQSSDSSYRLVGTFKVLDVTKSRSRYTVTAYDNIINFDTNVDSYLSSLTFPITLGNLFSGICTYCGCTADSTTFLNSTYSIAENNFSGNVTGRQVLNYIAEVSGSFIKCKSDGNVVVDWYKVNTDLTQLSTPTLTSSSGSVSWNEITNASGYEMLVSQNGTIVKDALVDSTGQYVNSIQVGITNSKYTFFNYQDFTVPTVDYVHIGTTPNDQGIRIGSGIDNAIEIINNPLVKITEDTTSAITTVATNIYNRLHPITYHAACVELLADYNIGCGDIIRVDGIQVYVMEKSWSESGVTLDANGDPVRDSGQLATQEEKVVQSTEGLSGDVSDLQDDVAEIMDAYLVFASVSDDVLTITDNYGVSIYFQGGGAYFG